jgi:hypothetical protein
MESILTDFAISRASCIIFFIESKCDPDCTLWTIVSQSRKQTSEGLGKAQGPALLTGRLGLGLRHGNKLASCLAR